MNIENILKRKYILASKSARRIKLLEQIGLNFKSIDSNFDELELSYHNPGKLVLHNSENKAGIVAKKYSNEIVIGADTIVVLKKKILNKPANLKEAALYLSELSGNVHTVYTGICVIDTSQNKKITGVEKTRVHFREIPKNEIDYYVKTYKPLDKAGAYGIQDDFGCLFIDKIAGDYYNVVGLPLVNLYNILKRL
jgi:septum formation protein